MNREEQQTHQKTAATAASTGQQGFTLIEIMVVLVILSILAAIIVPKIMTRPEQARLTKARQDTRSLESALQLYKLDNYHYPTTDQGLEALVTKPELPPIPQRWTEGGYIDRLLKDPWGNDYRYLNPGVHGSIDVFSMGPDGEPGNNDDIGNWNQE